MVFRDWVITGWMMCDYKVVRHVFQCKGWVFFVVRSVTFNCNRLDVF